MTEVVAYRLNELVAGEAINVRPGQDDVGDLVASIRAHGLLQPLVGRKRDDGKVEIIDGNRRLAALTLIDAEDDAADVTSIDWVHVVLRDAEPDADAFEVSLAANVLRKPLHPVREFEAFADLVEKGKDREEIAEHFGIGLRAVEQRLALGRLHQDVRTAWLEGRISGEAARAFTLVAPDEQAAYLRKAIEADDGWRLRADTVRRSFTAETVPADSAKARFIGADAYRAAGGRFVADLFAEQPDLADGDLLQRLVDERLAAEAARVKQEEGWGEVLFGAEAQYTYQWNRIPKPALPAEEKPARAGEIEQRLTAISERRQEIEDALDTLEWDEDDEPPEVTAQLREDDALSREEEKLDHELDLLTERSAWMCLSEAQRAKAIATIGYDRDGALAIGRGYTRSKPKAAPPPSAMVTPAPAPAAPGEATPEPVRLSAAVMDDLALAATKAAAHVLGQEPRIALAAFVATAFTWGSPLRIEDKGRDAGLALPWPRRNHSTTEDFAEVFRTVVAWDDERLQSHAARVIARTLDFTSAALSEYSYNKLKPQAVTALRAALPAQAHRDALVQAFDAAGYFSAAPKPEALAAIADCGDEPAKFAKLKKADLGAAAARLAIEKRWLPPLLRGEVFAAIEEAAAPDSDPDMQTAEAAPAEPGEVESAAAAAERIWSEADGAGDEEIEADDIADTLERLANPAGFDAEAWFASQKTPAIRAALKEMDQPAPVGWTKAQLVELAVKIAAEKGWRPADMAEAA